jgi:hypothetical protein
MEKLRKLDHQMEEIKKVEGLSNSRVLSNNIKL